MLCCKYRAYCLDFEKLDASWLNLLIFSLHNVKASPESALEGKAPPVIEETDSAIVLKEEKPVEDAINEVCQRIG